MTKETVVEKFLRYVQMNTQSARGADALPSTPGQLEFAYKLSEELTQMGACNVFVDENGCLYASIPATPGLEHCAAVGFLAHMDTACDASGAGIHPRVIKNYEGGEIVLHAEKGIVSSPERFPNLRGCIGKDLIVTDGTTLLGADDKAGVAEIMTMAQILLQENPAHGPVKIAFTPDEEVGGDAMERFDLERFGAKFAYTVDGGKAGGIHYENFNAADAYVTINGLGIHTGDAKGKLLNALQISMEFHGMLPEGQRPEYTEQREGFFYLNYMNGDAAKADLHYLIRDHDLEKFHAKKVLMTDIADFLNKKYAPGTVELKLADSYSNMLEQIRPHMHIVEIAGEAMRAAGAEPYYDAIRGVTDGSRLSYRGLPCPNLSTGGYNAHGIYEYACIQEMEQMVTCLLEIAKRYGQSDAPWNQPSVH